MFGIQFLKPGNLMPVACVDSGNAPVANGTGVVNVEEVLVDLSLV